MTARDWQPGDRAYIEVEVMQTMDAFPTVDGDVPSVFVSMPSLNFGELRSWVPAADLLPMPEPDEGAIERAAEAIARDLGPLPWDDAAEDQKGRRREQARRWFAAANLLASPVQPGPDVHPEDYCHKCGGENIGWHVDSPTWNAVFRHDDSREWEEKWGIVCPTCFAKLAESLYGYAHWVLAKEAEQPEEPGRSEADGGCGSCVACDPPLGVFLNRMYVCATCGNKRCPASVNCREWECSGSNDPDQPRRRRAARVAGTTDTEGGK